MPHRRAHGEELPAWKREHNRSHKQVRARVEHVFARMKNWKILRDCRLKGDSVHHAMRGVARLHSLNLAGQDRGRTEAGHSPASAHGRRGTRRGHCAPTCSTTAARNASKRTHPGYVPNAPYFQR
jgi:hypothetical protein